MASLDVDQLMGELTLQEKAELTSGSAFWWTVPVERLGIPAIMVADGPHGLRVQPGSGDHVGLGGSLPATCFPTASAIASSWNPSLVERVGQALGQEARACGLSVILGPGINMKRSPLCGRNFEYFSEDPHLAGELGVGMVDGIQSTGIGTSLKHFAANNQEDDRLRVDAIVDERTLREIYLPAFERVVTGSQPWTVMAAYNKINGVSATENTWLLGDVLRGEFGFTGLVVSDWGAVYDRVAAIVGGTDLEMPPAAHSPGEVVAAVESGDVDPGVLDERVRAVLELVAKGMHVLNLDESFDADAHHALAREAAAESVVLLTNNGSLPLQPNQRVGLIGELARTPRYQGSGSSQVNPTRLDTLADELGRVCDVEFAAGYAVDHVEGAGGSDSADSADGAGGDGSRPPDLRAQAVRVAETTDVVVMVVGLPGSDESEGFDRTHMDLPAEQIETLTAVAQANPNVVTVVVNGGAVVLGEVVRHSAAVLEAWLGGQAAGGAIADVLTGTVNPSGRLAESIPHKLADNTSYLNFPGEAHTVRYGEGVFIGYRGYDKAAVDVAFPFGFGLSYTTFELSDLAVEVTGSVDGTDLHAGVEVTVTNTGTRRGAEVVQVYVADPEASVNRPVRELRGFAKPVLDPGETTRIAIDLDQRAFAYWSPTHRRWVVEAGQFVIEAGHSSRDLPLRRAVSIDAPSLAEPLTRDSTLHEWLADPVGRQVVTDLLGERGVVGTDLVEVVGTMPMSTLANFGGVSLSHPELDQATTEWRRRSQNG